MTAIWLLSTRGRPEHAQATIDACTDTGMKSPGVVFVDGGTYPNLKLPKNWEKVESVEWVGLQGSMQYVFERFPDATAYGWLADDTRPRTHGWDRTLEWYAEDWYLVCAKDLWISENAGMLEQVKSGHDLSSGLCWGGELVRTVGWWALPGVKQAGIDTAWTELVRPFKLHRYVDRVTVEHLNWRTGKREYDDTDLWIHDGVDHITDDLRVREIWAGTREFRDTLRRIGLAVDDPGETRQSKLELMRQSYANDMWKRGHRFNAARLQLLMEGAFDAEIERFDTHEGQAGLDQEVRPVSAEPDTPGVGTDHP